jgi:hypothetical protein
MKRPASKRLPRCTNTVFVQYETADGAVSAKESAEHLAMLEMDGLRIARIRDLTTYATI